VRSRQHCCPIISLTWWASLIGRQLGKYASRLQLTSPIILQAAVVQQAYTNRTQSTSRSIYTVGRAAGGCFATISGGDAYFALQRNACAFPHSMEQRRRRPLPPPPARVPFAVSSRLWWWWRRRPAAVVAVAAAANEGMLCRNLRDSQQVQQHLCSATISAASRCSK
jgi:hypothetical protein